MTLRLALPLLVIACLAAGAVRAAGPVPAEQPPTWASLSVAQQSALAPLQRDWGSIDSARKQKWLEVASRFPKMPPSERERVQLRMAEWARMTPNERARARLQYQETRQFSPEDRQARWEAYKALPDDQRKALAQRAKPVAKAASAPENKTTAADASPKRNLVPAGRPAAAKPVAPTVLQARPGATTTLISASKPPPGHQQPGLPKIAATGTFVNPTTLLPRAGPQGAAVSAAAAPSASHP